jgi:hypothetical protein
MHCNKPIIVLCCAGCLNLAGGQGGGGVRGRAAAAEGPSDAGGTSGPRAPLVGDGRGAETGTGTRTERRTRAGRRRGGWGGLLEAGAQEHFRWVKAWWGAGRRARCIAAAALLSLMFFLLNDSHFEFLLH